MVDSMVVELNSFICNKNIGAKAKSMVDLYRYGYKVPRSLALDIEEFNNLLANVKYKIDAVIDDLNEDNIMESVASIEIFMDNLKLNKESLESLQKFLNINDKYMIRCSVENVNNYSFAGLFPAKYNISNDNIEDEIISCYKSLYSYNSLIYMLKNNIDIKKVSMALIIQREVKMDLYASVSTINPVTLNTSELNISISYNNKFEYYSYDYLSDRYIESDGYNIVSEEELDSIIKISKSIQSNFGYPIIFDLVISHGEIYVVQVRELTNLLYANKFNIWKKIHMSSKNLIYDLLSSSIDRVTTSIENEYKIEISNMNKCNIYFNGVYYNNNYFAKLLNNIIDYDNKYFKNILKENSFKLRYRRRKNNKKFIKNINKQIDVSKYDDLYISYIKKMKHILPSNVEVEWSNLVLNDYADLLDVYHTKKIYSFIYLNEIANRWSKVISIDELEKISKVDSDLVSYNIELEFNKLVKKIKDDEEAYRYWFSSSTTKLLENYNNNSNQYYHIEFKKYIDNYGYLTYSNDLSDKYYVEDVEEVIRHIKKSLSNYKKMKNNGKYIEAKKVSICSNLSMSKMKRFLSDIDNLQEFNKELDYLCDLKNKFNFLVKRYTKILSALYVVKENIDTDSDILFLDLKSIYNYIDGELNENDLKQIIDKNKLYYSSYRNFIDLKSFGSSYDVISKPSFKGIGYSTGVVTGNVKFINSINDIDTLNENDIFVTKNLNHNLLFKLPKIKGIILSLDHLPFALSNIIRELNIPCILLDNCSKKLSNGMIIEMDAYTGDIKIKKH